jgi:hypothetical protein
LLIIDFDFDVVAPSEWAGVSSLVVGKTEGGEEIWDVEARLKKRLQYIQHR